MENISVIATNKSGTFVSFASGVSGEGKKYAILNYVNERGFIEKVFCENLSKDDENFLKNCVIGQSINVCTSLDF